MLRETLRIACAQCALPASPAAALQNSIAAIDDAAARGARIVAFPEAYVPGYPWPGRPAPEVDAAFLEAAYQEVREAAKRASIAVVLGTERFVEGRRHLTALVVDAAGEVLGWQDKVQLDPYEDERYSPGTKRHVFEIPGLRFAVSICHEGFRYPETVRSAACNGAQLVFHPHWHEHDAGAFVPTSFADARNTFHEKALLCRAAENTCYVATINIAAEGAPTTSAVVNPDGSVAAWQPYGEAGLLIVDIDLSLATLALARRYRPLADA